MKKIAYCSNCRKFGFKEEELLKNELRCAICNNILYSSNFSEEEYQSKDEIAKRLIKDKIIKDCEIAKKTIDEMQRDRYKSDNQLSDIKQNSHTGSHSYSNTNVNFDHNTDKNTNIYHGNNEHIGKKIGNIATVFFYIFVAIVIIIALSVISTFCSNRYIDSEIKTTVVLCAFLISGITIFANYVILLMILGYAKIVEANELELQIKDITIKR